MSLVFHGIVVPPFDDDLSKENQRDGIKRNTGALLSLKFSIIKEISTRFYFLKLFF